MSVSLQKSTRRTNIKHNNRDMNEREKVNNGHIDASRSHENKYLVREDIRDLYEREFGDALKEYNEKQTRSDRKIDDYYKHIHASKKTSTQQEMIIQLGDKDDFASSDNHELVNEVLEEWFEEFEERNPNLKVYNAVVHNDEASPHMHLNFVPVASEYKRGLEKQVAFDRAIKQQDSTLNKTRPFDDWREKEVGLLARKLKERGIERKIVGKNEYKDVNDYKKKKDQLKEIEKEIGTKKSELEVVTKVVPDEKEDMPFLKKEKNFLQKETGNYVLSAEQYEQLTDQVHSAVQMKEHYEQMKNEDYYKKFQKAKEVAYEVGDRLKVQEAKNKELESKNGRLESEVYRLKSVVNNLKHEIAQVYQASKEFLRGHTSDLKSFRGVFKGFVDKVKDKASEKKERNVLTSGKSEFEKVHSRESKKERGAEMER